MQVTLEHVGVYAQAAEKLTAVLAANTPPDVMMLTVDTFMPGCAPGRRTPGRLHQGRQERQFETYVPGLSRTGRSTASSFSSRWPAAPPCSTSTRPLPCRRAARDGAGHVGPAAGHGAEADPRGSDGGGQRGRVKLAVPVAGYWWTFQAATWAFGGPPFGRQVRAHGDQNETVQAMQFLQDLVQRHRVARLPHGRALQHRLPARTAVFPGGVDRGVDADRGAHVRPRGRAFMPMQKQRAVPGGVPGSPSSTASRWRRRRPAGST